MATDPGPFLRWAGGKRQLLPVLLPLLPDDFSLAKNRFFEPFVGGGAVTWALATSPAAKGLKATKTKTKRPITINDVNEDLVATYKTIQSSATELIKQLNALERKTSEAEYYAMRDTTPTSDLDRAVRTIYLNKLGFNGLYRVRSDGKFNVPYGKNDKKKLCEHDLLKADSAWLSHVEIRSGSYIAAVNDAKEGDVVYFDPPYIPLSTTASFSKYAKDDFKEMDQWALAGVIRGLIERGVRVMLSNSDTPLTRLIFGQHLDVYSLSVTRSISAAASSRGKVGEIIGLSYKVDTAKVDALPSDIRLTHATRTTGAF